MDPKTAYKFLQAPLEGMTKAEKQELCRLIMGEPKEAPKKKKAYDPVPSVEWYKKQLLKSVFKSRSY